LKTTAGAKFCEWKIPEAESADIMEVNRNGVLRSSSIHPLCFTSRLFPFAEWVVGCSRSTKPKLRRGEKRRCPLVVAQHTVAMRVAAVTDMIATVPHRMAVLEASNKAIKILEAPAALGSFKYVMIWHPRMQTDAAHVWLRSTIRELAGQLS
jgi:DNA-binding transcriptional LysR family regulator